MVWFQKQIEEKILSEWSSVKIAHKSVFFTWIISFIFAIYGLSKIYEYSYSQQIIACKVQNLTRNNSAPISDNEKFMPLVRNGINVNANHARIINPRCEGIANCINGNYGEIDVTNPTIK